MTETIGAEPSPGPTPDDLAEAMLGARAGFLKAQNLIRVTERAEQRVRKHGKDPGAEYAAHRAGLEAAADRYLGIERRGREAILALCVQAARAGELTPEMARHALVAVSAGDAVLAYFDAHPERTTRTVAAGAADPADLEGMLAGLGRRMPATPGQEPEDA